MIALKEVLVAGHPIRELEPSLFSALDPDDEGAPYDTRAAAYDRLVATRWYNRVAWGVPPATHTDFITRALTSEAEGWVLDVAAGSCVASASAYPKTSRPLIILDRSLGMLRRGMARLRRLSRNPTPRRIPPSRCHRATLPIRLDGDRALSWGLPCLLVAVGGVCRVGASSSYRRLALRIQPGSWPMARRSIPWAAAPRR